MKKIIVSGHGHFASGLNSTMDLLAGKNDNVVYVDFTESDSEETLKEKYKAVINDATTSEFLFFCDLVGGTPYKVAATLAFENDHIEVVAGCNVGSLIEILFTMKNYTISELAKQIISISNNATGLFEKRISKSNKNEVEEDGI